MMSRLLQHIGESSRGAWGVEPVPPSVDEVGVPGGRMGCGTRARMAATAILPILGASPARGCPLCNSETGRRVREGIFDAQFGPNLLATLLPFPVFLAIVALVHFGPHAFTWTMTALGLALLWRAASRDVPLSTRTFVGSLLLGWGVFNQVKGLIDHDLLGIHHVVEAGNHLVWDLVFLASGVVLSLGGWAAIRSGRNDAGARAD